MSQKKTVPNLNGSDVKKRTSFSPFARGGNTYPDREIES